MWSKEQAQVVMRDLTQYVDVCIANDEDFQATLGIQAFDGDLSTSVLRNMHTVEEGDAYGAAFVHGLVNGFDPQKIVDFAISASVLKLMIQYDFNVVTQETVFKIMNSKNTNLSR